LRNSASYLVNQSASIGAKGQIIPNNSGIVSQPHKFYGGSTGLLNITNRSKQTYAVAAFQKYHIQGNYTFLKCKIENGTLICTGELQPENCDKYKIRIEFREGFMPNVFIVSPFITPKSEIHMYSEGCLCLFYPKEFKWMNTTKIADFTIPWIVEWILFYELWKVTGQWEGKEQSH
jgi:hypothetical protein